MILYAVKNLILSEYIIQPYRFIIDYNIQGDYIGFRVGDHRTLLYDTWDDNTNSSVVNLKN